MSLLTITLRDFVLVKALDLDFSTGFTVLTGETGAGKSLLIDALQFVLGARSDTTVIRSDADRCDVCAEFRLTPLQRTLLQEFVSSDEPDLLLRRSMDLSGRSKAWINGVPATVGQLRRIGELLVDIYGQHSWQSLERSDTCRALLDAYAQVDTATLKAAWRNWRARFDALREATLFRDRQKEAGAQLDWHLGELDRLTPTDGEWEQLQQQHRRLSNAQGLLEAVARSHSLLESEPSGALIQLNRVRQLLNGSLDVEPEFSPLCEELDSCLAILGEINRTLQLYGQRVDLEPGGLELLDQRIAAWISLSRRHRVAYDDLPALHARLKAERQALDSAQDLDALQRAERAAHEEWQLRANKVSAARKEAATRLEKSVSACIDGLGMVGGRFHIEVRPLQDAGENGLEEVRFLLSPYPDGELQTLGKVASGGELSRIALAIAATTSQLGMAGTLVFDEVDAGIGGAVAERVGKMLQKLAEDRQVLAVTHLPQVAAKGQRHLIVRKQTTDTMVISQIEYVTEQHRIGEIARMIAGEEITSASLDHAAALLSS